MDIYRTLHSTTAEYIFSSVHGRVFRIDHILGYKTNFIKFLKYRNNIRHVLQSCGVKLENNNRKR